MTAALALDTKGLRRMPGPGVRPVLRQASTFLTDLAMPGVSELLDEFGPGTVGGWARRFYGDWVKELSVAEYSALYEYKKEGFRSLNRGLRNYDGDLSMLPPEDRLRAEGLDSALEKAPALERPVVVYRGRLPDAVLEAFEAGEEDTLLDRVFGDPAYTSTSLYGGIARAYGGSSRFPDSVGKITLPPGTKAGCVDAVFDKGQHELLLPRGARFKIDRAYREASVYRIEGHLVARQGARDPGRRVGSGARDATRRRIAGGPYRLAGGRQAPLLRRERRQDKQARSAGAWQA